MKFVPGYTDVFMSPVSGRITIYSLPDLPKNYIWVGNRVGRPVESPIVQDIRIELRQLRANIEDTNFIVQHPSPIVPNAQVLDELIPGMLRQDDGVISIQHLTHNYFWMGDINNYPVEVNMFPIGALPNLTYKDLWRGDITNRPEEIRRIDLYNAPAFLSPFLIDGLSIPPGAAVNFGLYNLYTGGFNLDILEPIAPTTTLRVDMSNMPNLKVGRMWIGQSKPTPPVITIDGAPPFVHVVGSLNWDIRSDYPPLPPVFDPTDYGVPVAIGLGAYDLFTGNSDDSGDIVVTTVLNIINLPELEFGKIWLGDSDDRPEIIGLGTGLIFIGDPGGSGRITSTGLSAFKIFMGNPDNSNELLETGLAAGTIFLGNYDGSGQMIQTGLTAGRIFIGNYDNSGEIIDIGLLAGRILIGKDDGSGEIISGGLDPGFMFIGEDGADPGKIVQTGLPAGNIFMGDYDDSGKIITFSLDPGKMLIGDYDGSGKIIEIGLNPGKIFFGDPANPGQVITTGLGAGQMFIGNSDGSGEIISVGLSKGTIFIGKSDDSGEIVASGLGAGKIWIGNYDGSQEMVQMGLNTGRMLIGNPDGSGEIISTGLGRGLIFIGNPDGSGEIIPAGLSAQKMFIGRSDDSGEIIETGLSAGQVFMGAADGSTKIIITGSGEGLGAGKLFIGDSSGDGGLDQVIVLPIANMANLTSGKFWKGNISNRPVEVTLDIPNADATYILQTADGSLPNAQALDVLGGGILVANIFGVVSEVTIVGSVGIIVTNGDGLLGPTITIDGSELQDQIDIIEDEIVTIEGEIATIEGEIAAIEGEIAIIEGEILTLTADVAAIDLTLYDPTLGLVVITAGLVIAVAADTAAIALLNLTVDAPIIGLVARMNFITSDSLTGSSTIKGKVILQTADAVFPNGQALDALSGGIMVGNTSGVISEVSLEYGPGLGINNPDGIAGNPVIYLAGDELPALSSYSDNGFIVRYGSGDYIGRTINSGTGITVTNGDGIGGNPVIAISNTAVTPGSYTSSNITVDAQGRITAASNGSGGGTVTSVDISTTSSGITVGGGPITSSGTLTVNINNELQALSGLSSTGIVVRTGTATYTERTVTGTANQITVTNGDGIAANINIAVANNAIFPGTEGVTLPNGTTAQRPGSPNIGEIRFNTTTNRLEAYY